MRARFRVVAAGGVLLLVAGTAAAQGEQVPRVPAAGSASTETVQPAPWQIGVGVMASTAAGEFSAHIDNAGGPLIQIERRVVGVFSLGVESSILWYGHESRQVSLRSVIPEAPNAQVDVDTDNSMWLLQARVRAQRRAGRWRPYADALVGLNRLTTKTYVRGGMSCNGWGCTGENLDVQTHASDVAFSYGAGAGLRVGSGRPCPPGWNSRCVISEAERPST